MKRTKLILFIGVALFLTAGITLMIINIHIPHWATDANGALYEINFWSVGGSALSFTLSFLFMIATIIVSIVDAMKFRKHKKLAEAQA